MMINKRLIGTVSESKKYIAGNVVAQWCSLAANITMIYGITKLFADVYEENYTTDRLIETVAVIAVAAIVRFICAVVSSKMSFLSSKTVKKTLREKIYEKLLKLGSSYHENVQTSEVVQVVVEGCDQLETYFGAYLPQFFYAMLAPLTLFSVLMFVNIPAAIVLLVCVPLIPVSIAVVQTWAKKLLSKYWRQYTALGDTFLENLEGLTTLKIYKADEYKNEQMNIESEKFRKITMKVLTMQLNSVTIMDLVAYGGAALGVIMSVTQFRAGYVSLSGALFIILISADFFIPMRQLGSFFHIAMNGMAASDKIFRLLDLPDTEDADSAKGEVMYSETEDVSEGGVAESDVHTVGMAYSKNRLCPPDADIICDNLSFAYKDNPGNDTIKGVDITFRKGNLTALVGESGCGKSTISAILMGRNKGYRGHITVGGVELSDISEESLLKNITYISHQSFLFKGTVKGNLLMAKPDAADDELWAVLDKVNLAEFLRSEAGLDTRITERAGNFSGGQRQRLALARALLHDSPYYIFDEATSNIDVESEDVIMEQIMKLAKDKTVILISHRLANVENTDAIYVLDKGNVVESGNHKELLEKNGVYAKLWNAQMSLENYGLERNRKLGENPDTIESTYSIHETENQKEVTADEQ